MTLLCFVPCACDQMIARYSRDITSHATELKWLDVLFHLSKKHGAVSSSYYCGTRGNRPFSIQLCKPLFVNDNENSAHVSD